MTYSTHELSEMFNQGRLAILTATTEASTGDMFVTQGSVCRKDDLGDWYCLHSGATYDMTELARSCALVVWAIL